MPGLENLSTSVIRDDLTDRLKRRALDWQKRDLNIDGWWLSQDLLAAAERIEQLEAQLGASS